MPRIIYIFLLLLVPNLLSAQVEWGHQIAGLRTGPLTGGGSDITHHVVDRDGNIISVGSFNNSVTIGTTVFTDLEGSDIFIYKTSPSGQILWTKVFQCPSYGDFPGVATDKLGNIFVTGRFHRDLTYNGKIILKGPNGRHAFISKLDKAGNLLWVKGVFSESVNSSADLFRGLSVNSKGEAALAVYYIGTVELNGNRFGNSSSTGTSFLVAKFSPEGTLDWYTNPTSEYWAGIGDMKIDEVGNVLLTGFHTSTLNFGDTHLTTTTRTAGDIFLAKFGIKGDLMWAKGINKTNPGTSVNQSKALEVDPVTNDIYLTGEFKGSIAIGELEARGVNTGESPLRSDIFLAKFSGEGTPLWAKRVGTDEHDTVSDLFLRDNELVLSGRWGEVVSRAMSDPFIKSFDLNGNEVSEFIMDVSGGGTAYSVSALGNNQYFLSGFFSTSYQNGPVNWTALRGNGFMLKVNLNCLNTAPPSKPALSYTCTQIKIVNYDESLGITWYRDGTEITAHSSPTLLNPKDGTYTASFSNGCGTALSESIVFNGNQYMPPTPELTSDCRKISVQNQGQNEITWYRDGQLLPGEQNAELLLSGIGEYKAQFDNGCGVSSTVTTIDSYVPAQGFTFYNVITPNGDNLNEKFVFDPALLGSSLQIYNRWGKKVYESKNYRNDWDGKGQSASVYYWFLKTKCAGDIKGTVTIIR